LRRIVSKSQYCSTGDSRTEYSSWRPCSHTQNCGFTNPTFTVGLQLLNLIAGSNAQMSKQWCHDHKTWTSDNWKCAQYG
jgi:hypothetical protein